MKKIILSFLIEHFILIASAQEVIYPSPEVRALEQYGNIPVSTYTGMPNITIPIYTIEQKDIVIPITLSYHASGVKVNQEATTVGLGWVLNAGGVISRTKYGSDDFTNYYSNDYGGLSPYNSSDNSSQDMITYMGNPSFDWTGIGAAVANFVVTYDFAPDQYNFNFLGHSGRFVLKKNTDVVIADNRENLDIQLDILNEYGIFYGDGVFTVHTTGGTEYTFDIPEWHHVDANPYGYPTAWYLSKIETPTGNIVTFHYEANDEANLVGNESISQKKSEIVEGLAQNQQCLHTYGPSESIEYYVSKNISYIDFTNGRVTFEYTDDRIDLRGSKRLSTIKVYQKDNSGNLNQNPYKTFTLDNNHYFTTTDSEYNITTTVDEETRNRLHNRLKLKSVTESGKPSYQFKYIKEDETNVFRNKTSFAKDYWGYYNNANNNTLIPEFLGAPMGIEQSFAGADRDTDPELIKAFTLNEIIYPTGGRTEFDFEAHTFNLTGSQSPYMPNDLLINDRERIFYEHDLEIDNIDKSFDIDLTEVPGSAPVKVDLYGHIKTTYAEPCEYDPSPENTYFTEVYLENPDGTKLYFADMYDEPVIMHECTRHTFERSFMLTPGMIYTINSRLNHPNIEGIYFNYYWNIPKKINVGGGLRIKEIRDFKENSTMPINIRKFDYHYYEDKNGDGIDEEYTFGKIMVPPIHELMEIGTYIDFQGNREGCYEFIRSSNSMIYGRGHTVSYDQVTITYGDNGENGKSIFYYFNQPDFILSEHSEGIENTNGNPILGLNSGITSTPFSENGLLEREEHYKNSGNSYIKVREVVNVL